MDGYIISLILDKNPKRLPNDQKTTRNRAQTPANR